MGAVSCAPPGYCGAAGYYTDGSYDLQGVVVSGNSGTWGSGGEVVPPANAGRDPTSGVDSMSCPSAGNCSAVGGYVDSSGHTQGVLLTEVSGSWARGVELSAPANAASDPGVELDSVSCASPGNCTAVGEYTDGSNSPEGLLVSERSGVWAPGVEAPLPTNAAAGGTGINRFTFCDPHSPCVVLTSVSCASAGNCSAVGSYNDSSGNTQGLLLNETSGVWARGVELIAPAKAASNPDPYISSVSCPSVGDCSAVGTYSLPAGVYGTGGLLVSERSGVWAPAIEPPLPANAAVAPDLELTSVSCASAGNCAAVGDYTAASGQHQGLLLSETSQQWARGVEAVPPANAGYNPLIGTAVVASVSCASVGNCAAVGYYHDTTGNSEGLLLDESSGKWAPGIELAPPANAANGPEPPPLVSTMPRNVGLSRVSCAPTGVCAAVGFYADTTGNNQGLLVSGKLPLSPRSTRITRARISKQRRTASFSFAATNSTTFQCALAKSDTTPRHNAKPRLIFRACASPKSYRHLRPGHYTFEVRGVSSAGAVDPNPATKKFKIPKPRHLRPRRPPDTTASVTQMWMLPSSPKDQPGLWATSHT